jgi:FkbM family methyltransferase
MRRAIRSPPIAMEVEMGRPWFQALGIRTVIDVGANEGQFAARARRLIPSSRIISFEPIETCFQKLKQNMGGDPQFEAFNCALGKEEGLATFYLNDSTASSSLLAMKDTHRQAFPSTSHARVTQVPVRRLDDVMRGRELASPVMLKLDVQGYESQVLAGGPETVARCEIVLAEISLVSLYEGEQLAGEMIALLGGMGFRIGSIADCLRRPEDECPLQIDVIFVRS